MNKQATDTAARIAPIIHETYGKTTMADALIKELAWKIDADDFDMRGREHGIMSTCWMWYAGGDTATNLAQRIEQVLNDR